METALFDIKEILSDRELLNSFKGKSILITGVTGLIGSMLARTFDTANQEYDLGISISGLTRNVQKAEAFFQDVSDRINLMQADENAADTDCDYIIHTASPTASGFFVEYPVETIDSIITGTKAMLDLARAKKATLVYLSSMEEYGVPYEAGQVMTEDKVGVIDHLTARSCYPMGKRICECMCSAYSWEYGVDTRIVRLAQTFGAGIPLNDNRVSMQFARSVAEEKDIVLHTEGKSISNYCYLSDAISGILVVAIKGEKGEAYNICNDKETRSIYEIAELVANDVAGGRIHVVRDIPEGINYGYAPDNTMRLNSDKIRKLGWKPKVGMAEGYRRLVSYISEQDGNDLK